MKICFLQYSLAGGGAERKVCTLADYFASQGHDVEIGLFGKNIIKYDVSDKVKVTFIRRDTYQYNSVFEKAGFVIKRFLQNALVYYPVWLVEIVLRCVHSSLIKKINHERVKQHFWKKNEYISPIRNYIYNHKDSVFISMTVQCYLGIMEVMEKDFAEKRIDSPYIVMECSNPAIEVSGEVAKRRDRLYPMASRIVTMTQGAKDFFNEDIRRICDVIPNPVRQDLPDPYIGDRRKVVVNYCRFHEAKNLPLLIKAFAMFVRDYPEYSLELYGEGDKKEEVERLIAQLNIEDSVQLLPFDPHIHERIKDCAMFVSSSDWEGFGNSILEALVMGLPVISTDCDFGPRDMITDHVNGLLVPVNDTHALYTAMKEVADDYMLADRISHNAISARTVFSAERIGNEWLHLLLDLSEKFYQE